MVYLDASAFVKLAVDEDESKPLGDDLRHRGRWTSSDLLRVEAIRACGRVGQVAVRRAEEAIRDVDLVVINPGVLAVAPYLSPISLGSGDAIHLATALSLGGDLEAFYTYDKRLADAARAAGLSVRSPR